MIPSPRYSNTDPRPSYRNTSFWQNYQPFFPFRAQVTRENAPDEEWFEWRRTPIHIDRYVQADAPVTVVIVHGGGGYGRLFAPLGYLLNKAGYEVIAPDLPGYGLSHANAALIDYGVWVKVLSDLVRREYERNGRPVVLCGASIGGYLAYLCAAALEADPAVSHNPVVGIIATTLADPRLGITQRQFAKNRAVLRLGFPLMPLLARFMGNLALPIKWFTRMKAMSADPALSKLVTSDPQGGGVRVPLRFMNSIFTVKPAIEPEQFSACPVLLVHPAADRWTPVESSRVFFDRLASPKSIIMLENCGHFPVEEPGISQLEQAAVDFLRQAGGNAPRA